MMMYSTMSAACQRLLGYPMSLNSGLVISVLPRELVVVTVEPSDSDVATREESLY